MTISAWPGLPDSAVTRMGLPGSLALSGMRSQLMLLHTGNSRLTCTFAYSILGHTGDLTASVTISAWPGLPDSAVTRIGLPGSLALSGMRSQLAPPSLECSRMAGLPTIQPSLPANETDVKR